MALRGEIAYSVGVLLLGTTAAWASPVVVGQQLASSSTDSYAFTTVPAASATDYLEGTTGNTAGASTGANANGATIWASSPEFGYPGGYQGTFSDLTDGFVGNPSDPDNNDTPDSAYFNDGSPYHITIDLGSPQAIAQFNTYSRHVSDRVEQNYTLIGSNSATQNGNDFTLINPTTIATVAGGGANPGGQNTGGEVGVSIHDSSQTSLSPNGEALGDFQYLQMQILSDNDTTSGDATFYDEVDVVVTPEPASLGLATVGVLAILTRRRARHA
jgi:hypothetical protein